MNLIQSIIMQNQRRIESAPDYHIIPPITDPMGRHWHQPDRFDIEISQAGFGIAWMSQKTMDKLPEYSSTVPTGTYAGKMWRADVNRDPVKTPEWWLCWMAWSKKNPQDLLIHNRPIEITR